MKVVKNEKMEEHLYARRLTLADWTVAAVLAVVSLALYFASMANYVYPGESAHLAAVWSGLDSAPFCMFPLARGFASLFGYGNSSAPVCGAVAVVAMYLVSLAFLRSRFGSEADDGDACALSRVGGAVGAVLFMITPAVRSAATHLEPRMFDVMWALLAFLVLVPAARAKKSYAWLFHILSGAMCGAGLADSPLFLTLLPLHLAATWYAARFRGSRGYGAAALHLLAAAVAFAFVAGLVADFGEYLSFQKTEASLFVAKNWLFVAIFSTVPFAVSLLSCGRAFNDESSLMQWVFHAAMALVSIIAVATPFSPSMLMQESGILPVATSAFAAFTAGYVAAYWWGQTRQPGRVNESLLQETEEKTGVGRIVAFSVGGVFAAVVAVSALLSLFRFDGKAGAFADRLAERIIDDLGERTWFVTDGALDDHLRFAASRRGRELNLICLQRDLEKRYLHSLVDLVREKGLGGEHNAELASVSLSLGVLTFVQDWFAADPGAAKSVAVFGAPDLWYAAGVKPVPELLFFGADPARNPDWAAWKEIDEILSAPKGWGSYRIHEVKDPVERLRLGLRRHMGLVANNRGVWLQDEGRDEEAFTMYDLVLGEIDSDNVCALFNEFEMARLGNKRAYAKKGELERRLKAIVEDAERRYYLWRLANYYGYIRSPEVFIRLGCGWARSGRAGEALHHVRRAIDFVPSESRNALVNMMAALYASENDQRKSREMYESVIARDADNRDALVGLARLAMMDGDTAGAVSLLGRAVEAAKTTAPDDPRAAMDAALLSMLNGDYRAASAALSKLTDANPGNMEAWSLLAAVTMQLIDQSKDEAERSDLRKYLESGILATMEKQARSSTDYHLMATRAFVLLHKEGDNRRAARDAFSVAAKSRPDIAATADLVLELDIALNDTEDAERQAREILRRNRKAPLANYVMGSLALQGGRYFEAETFLRRAADAPKPVVLALNDLAEVLRRNKSWAEAEKYARKATVAAPDLYVAWETLGSILMDSGGSLDEAEECVKKACDLSKGKNGREADVRMLVSLARVQLARKDTLRAKTTLRKVQQRISELSEFERREFEELRKSAK